jgi:hypothetical protein
LAHTTEIERDGRCLTPRVTQQRRVINRRQRRALTSGRHICRAKVMRNVHPEFAREQFTVAQLPRAPHRRVRAMQHGQTVHADDFDLGSWNIRLSEKGVHRFGERERVLALDGGDRRWFSASKLPGSSSGNGLREARSQRATVRVKPPASEFVDFDAVRAYQRRVDETIERRTRHQTQGEH